MDQIKPALLGQFPVRPLQDGAAAPFTFGVNLSAPAGAYPSLDSGVAFASTGARETGSTSTEYRESGDPPQALSGGLRLSSSPSSLESPCASAAAMGPSTSMQNAGASAGSYNERLLPCGSTPERYTPITTC